MTRVGIVGGAGYAGGELIRLLVLHPQVKIVFVQSKSNAGNYLYDVHADLFGDTDMQFTKEISSEIDVLFLCLGHGNSKVFLQENKIKKGIKIIDLSQDYRLKASAENFVYGLPELNKTIIKNAEYIANPGCFATAIELALLPLASKNKLPDNIFINAITGSTGAGQKLSETSHFSWRANNISVYKAFQHQHLDEIGESLKQLQPEFKGNIKLIPERGGFTRGIFASLIVESELSADELYQLYAQYYQNHPFTHISLKGLDLKQVINTNKCLISIEKYQNDLLITSAIDNLLKGASGQAVQNMNLMFNLEETTGLKLKASAF